jgi:hypothetical protein
MMAFSYFLRDRRQGLPKFDAPGTAGLPHFCGIKPKNPKRSAALTTANRDQIKGV